MGDTFDANDLFKKGVNNLLESGKLSFADLFWGMLVSVLLGLFIFYIYRKTFRGVVYSHSYNVTFVAMTMITSLIIMTISSNVVLSLGMVGALSIVRFRTAVKDPMDVVFMFWSISAGISAGAGMYVIAILGSLLIGGMLWLLTRRKGRSSAYLLVIHYTDEAFEPVKVQVNKLNGFLKSKTVRKGLTEMTVEVKLPNDNTAFVNQLSEVPGVQNVTLVSYNGDYAP